MKARSLATAALAWLLVACGGPTPTASPTLTVMVSVPSALSVALASNDFPAGQPRVPFVLFAGSNPLADASAVKLTAFDLSSGTPAPGWTGEATAYPDYDIPYWVAYPELPHSGLWGLGVAVTLADGSQAPAQFTLQTVDDPSGPGIGEAVPATVNRTLATQADLALLTSDPEPEPGLYEMTVADALKTGKPTVVTLATPGFCASRLCAPVVNSLKALYADDKANVNFIHIEIYKSFDPLVYGPEMDEWHLKSEPWTFVVGADGKVVARLGGPVSPRELAAILAPLLPG